MTEPTLNNFRPGFVDLKYNSAYAPHNMRLGTRLPAYAAPGLANVSYEAWDASIVSAQDMVDDLLVVLKACHLVTTTFFLATFYDFHEGLDSPIPIATYAPGVDGTDVSVAWNEATMVNLIGRDTAGNVAKLVLLDVATGNNWNDLYLSDIAAAYIALWDEFSSVSKAWQSRKNYRPDILVHQTAKLSDALRKRYYLN